MQIFNLLGFFPVYGSGLVCGRVILCPIFSYISTIKKYEQKNQKQIQNDFKYHFRMMASCFTYTVRFSAFFYTCIQ